MPPLVKGERSILPRPERREAKETHLENKPIPGRLEQLPELLLSPLLRIQQREHDDVHAAHDPLVPGVFLARLTQAVVVDDDARARLEGGHQVAQDAHGVGGRVIVHDPAEEVDCSVQEVSKAGVVVKWEGGVV